MRIVPVYIQGRCEQSGLPKEKVSRYTVRPGTLGLTLGRDVTLLPSAPLMHIGYTVSQWRWDEILYDFIYGQVVF